MKDGKAGSSPDTGTDAEALTLALLDRDTLQAALDCAQLEKEELEWRLNELRKGVYKEQPTRSNFISFFYFLVASIVIRIY